MTRFIAAILPVSLRGGPAELKVWALVATGLFAIAAGSVWRRALGMASRGQGALRLCLKSQTPAATTVRPAPLEQNFFAQYCQTYQCDARAFTQEISWRCLPVPAIPLALVASFFKDNLFEGDLDLLDEVRGSVNDLQVQAAIIKVAGYPSLRGNILRDWLKIRISPAKLSRLSVSLLGSEPAFLAASLPHQPLFKAPMVGSFSRASLSNHGE